MGDSVGPFVAGWPVICSQLPTFLLARMLRLPRNLFRRRRAGSARRPFRRPTPARSALLLFAGFVLLRLFVLPVEQTGRQTVRSSQTVHWVIDGDTFDLQDGRRIRLLGIDAPELPHLDKPGELWAEESTAWLKELIERRPVSLQFQGQDKYGRHLAWVWTADGRLINQASLNAGMSRLLDAFGLPPDLEPSLRQAESEARLLKKGLWKKGRKR
ncbi:MAG: thermonuclease family protein [Planctomyces sp.]